MKWFKHESNIIQNSETLQKLIIEFEGLGYIFYMRTYELASQNLDEKREPKFTKSLKELAINCFTSQQKLKKIINFLSTSDEIIAKFVNENFLEIEIPNLLNLLDDTMRKSGVSKEKKPDSDRNNSVLEVEVEVEVEREVLKEKTKKKNERFKLFGDWSVFQKPELAKKASVETEYQNENKFADLWMKIEEKFTDREIEDEFVKIGGYRAKPTLTTFYNNLEKLRNGNRGSPRRSFATVESSTAVSGISESLKNQELDFSGA